MHSYFDRNPRAYALGTLKSTFQRFRGLHIFRFAEIPRNRRDLYNLLRSPFGLASGWHSSASLRWRFSARNYKNCGKL